MTVILMICQVFSQIFLGGMVFLTIAAHFKGDWAQTLSSQQSLWRKMFFVWVIVITIFLISSGSHYPWHELHGNKAIYFNTVFVVLRNIVLSILMWVSLAYIEKIKSLSLFLVFIVGNLFAFDWAMSTEGHWFSNMYGLIYMGNGAQAAMATILLLGWPESDNGKKDYVHLLLVSSIMWFYLHFSQFIIMWMGNLPREVEFYVERWETWGGIIILATIVLKLFPIGIVSFFPEYKTNKKIMNIISVLIIFMCVLETCWLVRYP